MRAVASLAVVVTAVGCASGAATPSEPEAVETPTSTTRTPRVVDDSGRPQITFDPCLDIPDDLLASSDFDPRSKGPIEMPMGTYSFLGCDYRGTLHIPGVLSSYSLIILSGNVTLEEELAKNGHVAIETTVNGRRALQEIDPSLKGSCAYVVQSSFGIVILSRIYHADHSRAVPQHEWCAGFAEFVVAIEPLIEK
ncbi:DUF3558 domain-containing protein [Rhodococcus sp. 7Tela_A2]|uniref:DUF3558 domain-containing protein n=1 Tax=Rhodococcus sp. 7Tela_A2 TaxID=3093744 RepID=UPI003BB642A6